MSKLVEYSSMDEHKSIDLAAHMGILPAKVLRTNFSSCRPDNDGPRCGTGSLPMRLEKNINFKLTFKENYQNMIKSNSENHVPI